MPNATFYGETGDGYLYAKTDAHFSEAREATSADEKDTTAETIRIGLEYNVADKYRFYRGFLYFDTSSLPDNATITAATLKIYLVGNLTLLSTGIKVILFHASDRPSDPLSYSDFNLNHYASGGADDITVYTGQSGYQIFTLNATGYSWINLTGKTAFCLRTEQDVSPTLPNLYMLVDFYSADKGVGYRPVLEVTYGEKATVGTDAATGIGSSYATGNGSISDVGDGSLSEYGFIWNDDGSDPVDLASADNKVVSTNLSGGVFSASITALTPEKTYYYRAYATTEYGTAYGDAVDFTTTAAPLGFTVTTQNPDRVLVTSATCRGTIVEDNGYTITQHGVIYALEADPGTPSDPTTAEGYTQEGTGVEGQFTSEVTGLTADSTYFCRAYAQTTDDGGHVAYGGLVLMRTGTQQSTNVTGESGDGYLYYFSGYIYDSCPLTPTPATSKDTTDTNLKVYSYCAYSSGQGKHSVAIQRSYVYFDTDDQTTGIPSDADIISVKLWLYVNYVQYEPGAAPIIRVASGQPDYPSETNGSPDLSLDDFDISLYTKLDETEQIYESDVPCWISFDIPHTELNRSGLTKFMVYKGTIGAYVSYAYLNSADASSNKPYLEIQYAERTSPAYPKVQVGDEWKSVEAIYAVVGGVWKYVKEIKSVIGGVWKDSA